MLMTVRDKYSETIGTETENNSYAILAKKRGGEALQDIPRLFL
jgi:hypothetical protein